MRIYLIGFFIVLSGALWVVEKRHPETPALTPTKTVEAPAPLSSPAATTTVQVVEETKAKTEEPKNEEVKSETPVKLKVAHKSHKAPEELVRVYRSSDSEDQNSSQASNQGSGIKNLTKTSLIAEAAPSSEETPLPADPIPPANLAPQPLPTQSKEEPRSFKQYSYLTISPEFSFSSLSSTDKTTNAQATLGSGLNYGVGASWSQLWSESFRTKLSVSGKSETYSATSSLPLNNSNQFYGAGNVEACFGRENFIQETLNLGVAQTPFLRGASAGSNIIDPIAVPQIGVGISLPLYDSDTFSIKFSPGINYLLPVSANSYDVQSGYAVIGKISLDQKPEDPSNHNGLGADLFFMYQNQNTTLTTQNFMAVGGAIRFSFDFFKTTGSKSGSGR